MPRFESSGCSPNGALGERNANCSHNLKVANPARLVPLTLSGGSDAKRRWGDGTEKWNTFQSAPQRGPGAAPRHAFGSFRRETKGTPGVGRVGPPIGGAQRRALPSSHWWVLGLSAPAKKTEGSRSTPFTYTPKRTKSCIPTCNRQGKNLPSAGKNLRCAVAETRIGHAIMAQQKSEGIFPRFFAAYSKFSGAFDIPSHSRAPCCGCAWRSRLRRFPAG